MPIKPENAARYPKDWKEIRARILYRAKYKCEFCGVENHVYRNRVSGQTTSNPLQAEAWEYADGEFCTYIVLTVAHLNHTPEDCRDENLKALCQRCHLAYDHKHHQQNSYQTRRKGKAIQELI